MQDYLGLLAAFNNRLEIFLDIHYFMVLANLFTIWSSLDVFFDFQLVHQACSHPLTQGLALVLVQQLLLLSYLLLFLGIWGQVKVEVILQEAIAAYWLLAGSTVKFYFFPFLQACFVHTTACRMLA